MYLITIVNGNLKLVVVSKGAMFSEGIDKLLYGIEIINILPKICIFWYIRFGMHMQGSR